MRILFIDRDVEHARELYSQVLSYKGVRWDLLHCTTVGEAWKWLERDQFDLILITVYQQDRLSEGYETLIGKSPNTPVVVLSDSQQDADHLEFIRMGANDSLPTYAANGPYVMRRIRMAVSRYHQGLAAAPALNSAKSPANSAAENSIGDVSDDVDSALSVAAEFAVTTKRQTAEAPVQSTATVDANVAQTILLVDEARKTSFGIESDGETEFLSIATLPDALELVESSAQFAAVVAHQGVIERDGVEQLLTLQRRLHNVPVIVVMIDRSDSAAINYIDQGIDDCEIAANTNRMSIERSIRLARVRIDCQNAKTPQINLSGAVSDRRSNSRGERDRRRVNRYVKSESALAIPVLPNGAPDKSQMCEAVISDISTGGLGIQLPTSQIIPSRNWVIGFKNEIQNLDDCVLHFVNVVVRNVSYPAAGVRMGTAFPHPADDLFRDENRMPRLDPATSQLVPQLSTAALDDWCDVGVMRRILIQRTHSCPECSGVAAIGNGCRECGSSRFEFQNIIHHYACAYFGLEQEFESDHGLACPKCRMKGLVVGADFELIKARYQCNDCGCETNELEQVCNCLNCQLRFPLRMAREQRVYGYDVTRLDLLAYLSSAT